MLNPGALAPHRPPDAPPGALVPGDWSQNRVGELRQGRFAMSPLLAMAYSFLFGLLHGIVPDEHTWPITLSYAMGGASGREGIKAALYFSAAFTAQRMLISELASMALSAFLFSRAVHGIVYVMVGLVMSSAGAVLLGRNRYLHVHLISSRGEVDHRVAIVDAPPPRWALIHGFIAGFGFGGFSIFVNTVAAPAMPRPWLGFLPGLFFGLGTMITLVIVGAVFGASLKWAHSLTESEARRIGAQAGGRMLLFGGALFGVAGVLTLLRLDRDLPVDTGYAVIGLFIAAVAIPSVVYSAREVLRGRNRSAQAKRELCR